MKSKEKIMNFYFSTLCDKNDMGGRGLSVNYITPKMVGPEEYKLYMDIFVEYVKAATKYGFDIAQVVADIRSLFRGTNESRLHVKKVEGKEVQEVAYTDSVECYFENSDWNNKINVKDEKIGTSIDVFRGERHIDSETREETMEVVNDYLDKIVELKGMKRNQYEEEKRIFGYTPDKIREEGIKFEFGVTIQGGLEIKHIFNGNTKPINPKRLINEPDLQRLAELDEIARGARSSNITD